MKNIQQKANIVAGALSGVAAVSFAFQGNWSASAWAGISLIWICLASMAERRAEAYKGLVSDAMKVMDSSLEVLEGVNKSLDAMIKSVPEPIVHTEAEPSPLPPK